MGKNLARIFEYLKQKPGLTLLLVILFIITLSSLKPQFYLLGWDNYSPYFNIPNNIFRTFFATWREYRGLGVPSDSEVTDLFRNLFYLILKPFVPGTLLDQIYILMALNVGIISMYIFSCLLFNKYLGKYKNISSDIFGFFSSFFYLFNLNTLSTFNFPVITYTNRFFTIPLIFTMFYLLLSKKHVSLKTYLFFVVIALFTSGSYITATVLITILIALFIFGIFQGNLKRFVIILAFYLGLQAFWLLPFFNYTLQKSKIIKLAPNFITANEIQLNKQKSFYDIKKNLILYPNFFDTKFYDILQTKELRFHSLATELNNPFFQIVLWTFPVLYIFGSIFVILKHRRLIWIPSIVLIFLFLSLKEYSPLGFLYSFLNNLTPYFGVLFRFGDTKFHPFIAFGGSLLAGVTLIIILQNFRRLLYLFLIILLIPTIIVFQDYFKGKFIGSFMYNRIPQAYFDIASILNRDSESFRVLHLPFEEEGYWKSYSWGMVGSSFIHFLVNHPFIDKTFEPASMENAYLNNKIQNLLTNTQSLQSDKDEKQRASEFATLLNKAGVKYIILDNTVQAGIYSRGILLWGKFNKTDAEKMAKSLKDYAFAKTVKNYNIDLNEYSNIYSQWYKLTDKEKTALAENSRTNIELIELNEFQKEISFLPSATTTDPNFNNILETTLATKNEHLIQDKDNQNYKLFPFKRRNIFISQNQNEINFQLEQLSKDSKKLNIQLPKNNNISATNITNFIDLYAKGNQKEVTLSFYLRNTPIINNTIFIEKIKDIKIPVDKLLGNQTITTNLDQYISDWSTLGVKTVGGLRVKIGNYVLPLPADLKEKSSYIATTAVEGETIPLEILSFTKREQLNPSRFTPTDNPNCFNDKLDNANYQISNTPFFAITSQNQSTCLYYSLEDVLREKTDHAELLFNLNGESFDLDKEYLRPLDTSKPRLDKTIRDFPKPNTVGICAKEGKIDDCYNLHQFINVAGDVFPIFPLEKPVGGITNMGILLSLKNIGYQKQKIAIKEMAIDKYNSVISDTITMPSDSQALNQVIPYDGKSLTLTIPKVLSPFSFFFDPKKEVLNLSNGVCDKNSGYRTFRIFNDELFSYVENCFNVLYQQQNNFSSTRFYLWWLSYNLLSGKFPRFIVDDKFHHYINEYISLYQGYPDIKGFKNFQEPEMWYDSLFKNTSKLKGVNNIFHQLAFGYLNPAPELSDFTKKQLLVQQDSENEGVMMIDSLGFQPLPQQWNNLEINVGPTEQEFSLPEKYSYNRILPSLWKVNISNYNKASNLLLFNQGFDNQWRVYDSLLGVVLGTGKQYKPKRCDGYANCFLLKEGSKSNKTMYIFYTPERLSFLGWLLTIITGVLFIKIFTGRFIKKNPTLLN